VELTRDGTYETAAEGILENSIKIATIGLKSIPENFDPDNFLDTLVTYADSSYLFGWVTDKGTKNKYETYFTNAKDALINGDISSARSYLQNVLTDVDADSSSTLSSEAYALLRYNTEYLLKQLR
jgi:hypothetical protein